MGNKVLKIINAFLLSVLTAVIILLAVFGTVVPSVAYAAESEEVLRDLRRDKTFNEEDYPYKPESTALEVITVAEGEGEQLFIYVYNPSMNALYNATYLRMSYTIGNSYSPSDYALELVSSTGVFQKYFVKDFHVRRDTVRYYDICKLDLWTVNRFYPFFVFGLSISL